MGSRQNREASGEEGRIIALESAWDQPSKQGCAALAGLLADKLVYVDYDGTLSNKAAVAGEHQERSSHLRADQQ